MTIKNQQFKNGAETILTASISSVSTSMTVEDGTKLPQAGNGAWFEVALSDGINTEFVFVTDKFGNQLTIERGQDSIPQSFGAGTSVSLRVTARWMNEVTTLLSSLDDSATGFAPKINPTFTGTVSVPTPSSNDDSNKAVNSAWVNDKVESAIAAAISGTGAPDTAVVFSTPGVHTFTAPKSGTYQVRLVGGGAAGRGINSGDNTSVVVGMYGARGGSKNMSLYLQKDQVVTVSVGDGGVDPMSNGYKSSPTNPYDTGGIVAAWSGFIPNIFYYDKSYFGSWRGGLTSIYTYAELDIGGAMTVAEIVEGGGDDLYTSAQQGYTLLISGGSQYGAGGTKPLSFDLTDLSSDDIGGPGQPGAVLFLYDGD